MDWRPKNVNDSFFPFNTLYAIIGYTIFQYPIGHPRLALSVVYATIVTLIYWMTFAWVIRRRMLRQWLEYNENLIVFIIVVNFVIAVLSQILSWCHTKRCMRLMRQIGKIDVTLLELGATFDYTKAMKMGIVAIVYWLLTVCCLNAIDLMLIATPLGLVNVIVVAILQCPIHLNSAVGLHFVMLIKLMEDRFSKINKLLENMVKPVNENLLIANSSQFFGKEFNGTAHNLSSNQRALRLNENRKNLIQTIKHVHLELTRISMTIDRLYGLRMLLRLAAYFVMFTGLTYILWFLAMKSQSDDRIRQIIVVSTWIIVHLSMLMSINNSCGRTIGEAQKSSDFISLPNHEWSEELLNEIRQFSFQLMNNPVKFSPVGFFDLGHRFAGAFFGMVVTYVVILMDMGNKNQF